MRENQNILTDIHLSLSEAILGCNITIQTVDGKMNISVPKGTGDGH